MTHILERGFEPARFLVDNIELLAKGRSLDVAIGYGENAIYVTKMGFEGYLLASDIMTSG